MSAKRIVTVMAFLILIFLVGGLLMAVILDVEDFLGEQGNKVTINNQDTWAQLATHVALRAYHCNSEGGGQPSGDWVGSWTGWEDWRAYVEYAESHSDLSFEDLRNSKPGGRISCSGTAATLPFQDATLKQGLSNFNPVQGEGGWGNDQEGRFSRMEFKFNESMWLTADSPSASISTAEGCYGFSTGGGPGPNGITPFIIDMHEQDEYAAFEMNTDSIDGYRCAEIADTSDTIKLDDNSGGDQHGAWVHMIMIPGDGFSFMDVIDEGPYKYGYTEQGGTTTDIDANDFYICEGAQGYIQANTGGKNANFGEESSIASAHYTPENPPGADGEQVGGTQKTDNAIRLFAVFTKQGDC